MNLIKADGGKIFLVAILLVTVYFASLLAYSFYDFDTALKYFEITLSHSMFGRAAGLSLGYVYQMSDLQVIVINIVIETILVFLSYSLFLMGINAGLNFKALKSWVEKSRQSAEKYKDTIEKYGVAGLMFFVFLPFFMTGPIIGSIIGYFLGFSHKKTLTVVLFATYFAIVCWAFILKSFEEALSEFDKDAPLSIFLIIVVIAVFGIWKNKNSNSKLTP